MNATATFLDASHLRYLSTHTPFYYTPNVQLFPGLPDHLFALAVPVISYWFLSIFFHILDISEWKWLDKYRLHESQEVKSRNLVSRTEVVRAVILQQVIQTAMGLWWVEELPTGGEVDHVAKMLRLASWQEWATTWGLGEQAGRQLLASRGADGLYTLYWWALPVARFFLGMCVSSFVLWDPFPAEHSHAT